MTLKIITPEISEIASFLISTIGNIDTNLSKLEKYKFNKTIKEEIKYLLSQFKWLKEFSQINIFIDPLEVDEIDYHDNIRPKFIQTNIESF